MSLLPLMVDSLWYAKSQPLGRASPGPAAGFPWFSAYCKLTAAFTLRQRKHCFLEQSARCRKESLAENYPPLEWCWSPQHDTHCQGVECNNDNSDATITTWNSLLLLEINVLKLVNLGFKPSSDFLLKVCLWPTLSASVFSFAKWQ